MEISIFRDYNRDTPDEKAYMVGNFDGITASNYAKKLKDKNGNPHNDLISTFQNYLRAIDEQNRRGE